MTRSLEKKTNKKPSSHSLGVCFVRPLMLHILVPFLPGPFFMTFSQSFAEMRIRTEIQRSLSLFVLYIQIGSISGQEEGDWCTALFIGTLCSQTHKKLEMEKKELLPSHDVQIQWYMSNIYLLEVTPPRLLPPKGHMVSSESANFPNTTDGSDHSIQNLRS